MRVLTSAKVLGLLVLCQAGYSSAQTAGSMPPPPEAPRPAEHGVINFLEPIAPDPVIQHSKEIYVLYGCAYCHGVDLRVRNGEATDLLHSEAVAHDVGGNVISAILRNGIPQTAKLSPMPQFADLSEADMQAIARWIHYARMQGRFEELMKSGDMPGEPRGGKSIFDSSCAGCHSTRQAADMVKKTKTADLKATVLRPGILTAVQSFKVDEYNDASKIAARTAHSAFTENSRQTEVANLLAYLKTLN